VGGERWPTACERPLSWWALAFQTVIVTFASYLMWFWLLRHYPATRVSAFTLLTPVFGLLAGVLLLSEPVTLRLLVALIAVAAGIALVNRRPAAPQTASPATPTFQGDTMITLCGFPMSNYYNKVKLVLLEKGIPLHRGSRPHPVERRSRAGRLAAGQDPLHPHRTRRAVREPGDRRLPGGAWPAAAAVPADPFAAAKVRELVTYIDLHLELVARELYGQAFFGGTVDDAVKERVRKQLAKNIAGFQRLAKFSPYVAGDHFTLADCSAWVSLPLVAMATKSVLGEDLLAPPASTGRPMSSWSASAPLPCGSG
jgi:glutathione S-transferase